MSFSRPHTWRTTVNEHETRLEARGVLLVHGAWYSATSWLGVAERLRKLGVPVGIAELHRGSLAADVEAATSALDAIDTTGPVIACGHSYGGTVITGLDPAKVAHLVYMAGPMPDVGESSLGLLASEPTGLVAALKEHGAGTTVIDPAAAGDLLFNQLDPERRAVNVRTLVPQAMAAGHESLARIPGTPDPAPTSSVPRTGVSARCCSAVSVSGRPTWSPGPATISSFSPTRTTLSDSYADWPTTLRAHDPQREEHISA
jgi:pimeloyl-ACP methyl ester carboxylesterase